MFFGFDFSFSGRGTGESDKWLAAAPASHFFCALPQVENMLEILGFVLELLPDFLIEYLLGQFFRALQEL